MTEVEKLRAAREVVRSINLHCAFGINTALCKATILVMDEIEKIIARIAMEATNG